jgi:hypothetical protein
LSRPAAASAKCNAGAILVANLEAVIIAVGDKYPVPVIDPKFTRRSESTRRCARGTKVGARTVGQAGMDAIGIPIADQQPALRVESDGARRYEPEGNDSAITLIIAGLYSSVVFVGNVDLILGIDDDASRNPELSDIHAIASERAPITLQVTDLNPEVTAVACNDTTVPIDGDSDWILELTGSRSEAAVGLAISLVIADLDTVVVVVGDIDETHIVDGDACDAVELARCDAPRTEAADVLDLDFGLGVKGGGGDPRRRKQSK